MTHMIQDRIRIWIRLRIKTKTKTINEIVEDLQKEYKNKDFKTILGSMTDQEYPHFVKPQEARPIFSGTFRDGSTAADAVDLANAKSVLKKSAKGDIMSSDKFGFRKIQGERSIEEDIGTLKLPLAILNTKLVA